MATSIAPDIRVDANRVAAILREQLADANMHNAVLTVALEDARARIAELSAALVAKMDAESESESPALSVAI